MNKKEIKELFRMLCLKEGSDVVLAQGIIIENIKDFKLDTLKRLHFRMGEARTRTDANFRTVGIYIYGENFEDSYNEYWKEKRKYRKTEL